VRTAARLVRLRAHETLSRVDVETYIHLAKVNVDSMVAHRNCIQRVNGDTYNRMAHSNCILRSNGGTYNPIQSPSPYNDCLAHGIRTAGGWRPQTLLAQTLLAVEVLASPLRWKVKSG
jgi:hypothetical protein